MIKKILLVVLGVIALLAFVSLLLPRIVTVERSTTIAAPTSVVFEQVNELHNWKNWSPWYEKDPNAEFTYSDPSSGPGSSYSWVGDPKTVGTGSLKITAVEPNKSIDTDLDFGPQGTAKAGFKFNEANGSTQVTWGFETDMGMNPIGKYFGLMMDSMLGADYEAGLAKLKKVSEEAAAMPAVDTVPVDDVAPQTN